MRFLTLNIGASKATVAEYVENGKHGLTLTAYGNGDLSGVDVNDPMSLTTALPPVLHQILRENGIKAAPAILSLNGQTVFPRFAKFPPIADQAKLDQLVGYEIEQNVPFPVDEIVSDCQFLGTTPEGDRAALIVAAKLEGVRAVTDAAVSAGLKPLAVDVSPMAVCNAFRFANPGLTGCTVLLDIGAKTTNLVIFEDEKIYNRSIPVAGNAITKEIAQAFGCSMAEAEQAKIERGYVSLGGVTEDADEEADRISKIIRTVLTRLHVEVSRSINFYRSQQGGSAPVRLVLTGGSVRLPQLDQFFMESLQVEVSYLNPFAAGVSVGAKVDSSALENDAFTLAESVGLALRRIGRAAIVLDLMPPELVAQARAIRRIPFLATGAVAFLMALGAAWLAQTRATDVARAQLDCVNGRNGRLEALTQKLKAGQKAAADACAACDEFQQLMRQRSDALLRVRAVRESLIPGMWITSWQPEKAKDGTDAAAGVQGARVTIRGWRDAMAKAEQDWAARNGGRRSTAATIVEASLKRRLVLAPESVKIVAQRDVKESLVEFTIQIGFAPAPSAAPVVAGRAGKAVRK